MTTATDVKRLFSLLAQRAQKKQWSQNRLRENLSRMSKVKFPAPEICDAKEMSVRVIDYFDRESMEQSGCDLEKAVVLYKIPRSQRVMPALGHAAKFLLQGASSVALGAVGIASYLNYTPESLDRAAIVLIGGTSAIVALALGVYAVKSLKKAFWSAAETHYAAVIRKGAPSLALARVRVAKPAVNSPF